MAEVKGFKAIRYAADRVGSLDDAITPPFDVISDEQRALLFAKSPYNYARVILPDATEGKTKYEAAASLLETWLAEGVLQRDDEDSIYLLAQQFMGLDGETHLRKGFFAVCKLPEPGEDTILGHERTFAYKIQDRLALTTACRANTGAVFVLYDDPERALAALFAQMEGREPDLVAHTIDGVTQRVWRVPAPPVLSPFFRDKRLYIADGHHRFATALAYRDQARQQGPANPDASYEYVLLGFIPLNDPGLIVYPAHRVLDAPEGFDERTLLEALAPWFAVEALSDGLPARVNAEANCALGLATRNGGRYLLRLKNIDRSEFLGDTHGPAWRDLDVAVLHAGVLERVMGLPQGAEFAYIVDPKEALAQIEEGRHDLAFFVRNMNPGQICSCANAGEFMPQKATYFYPKLPSGAVINPIA